MRCDFRNVKRDIVCGKWGTVARRMVVGRLFTAAHAGARTAIDGLNAVGSWNGSYDAG
jgi:hypothetical protein